MVEKQALTALFEKYIRKLRITPTWDIRLEFVEDPAWPKTGDIKIDCTDSNHSSEYCESQAGGKL